MTKKYLDGLEAAERTLQVMPDKVQKQLVRGLNKWRVEAEKRAASLAPGSIAENVKSDLRETKGGTGIESVIQVDDFRAGWVEFGTQPHSLAKNASVSKSRRQSEGRQHPGSQAQPFFWPAIRGVKKRMRAGLMRSLRKAAKEIASGGR